MPVMKEECNLILIIIGCASWKQAKYMPVNIDLEQIKYFYSIFTCHKKYYCYYLYYFAFVVLYNRLNIT